MAIENLEAIIALSEEKRTLNERLRQEAQEAILDLPRDPDSEGTETAFYHLSRIVSHCGSSDNLINDIAPDIIEIESAINNAVSILRKG